MTVLSQRSTPLPFLLRMERGGLVDTVLFAIALVQALLLAATGGDAAKNERPLWLVVAAAFTWALLLFGNLAPLLRRTAIKGSLPSGAGLWTATYGLMFAAWLTILFNTDPEGLWGFRHFVRLSRAEFALAASGVPLCLAPLWRRLARAARLRWLKRKWHGCISPGLTPWLLLAAAAAYCWVMRDRFIMSDGWGLVTAVREHTPLDPIAYREPGIPLLLRAVHHVLGLAGLNAGQTIGLTNFLAMAAAFGLIAKLMKAWELTARQRTTGWWLALSALGMTQMALGRVELYPLLECGLTATAVGGLMSLAGRWSPAWMVLAFALTLAGHLSAIFVLPAVLWVLWLWSLTPAEAARPSLDRRRLVRAAIYLFGIGAAIHLPLWGYLMLQLPDPTPVGLIRAVTGSLQTGPAHATFLGSEQSTLWRQLGQIFSAANLFKILQILFYLAAGPLLALLTGLGARRAGPVDCTRAFNRSRGVVAIAWLGYGLYGLTWRADWNWEEDWDLFSGLAPLTVLVALRWLMPEPGRTRLPHRLVRHLCLFAIALSFTQHYFFHTRVAFLSSQNKPAWGVTGASAIQRWQLEHPWHRDMRIEWVDNQHVVIKSEKGQVLVILPTR